MTSQKATAAKVDAAREGAGLSRLALSERAGIAYSPLWRKLNGHTPFTVTDIDLIAGVLRVDPTTLVVFEAVA